MDRQTKNIFQLTECITQLASWHHFNDPRAPEMTLYWAKKADRLLCQVKSAAEASCKEPGSDS